ncbi:phage holin family protein [Hoylesella timonensis]|nr:phage holin family protein [Hoylesella timonensis]
MSSLLNSIRRFLSTYGWVSNKEFMLSLFPSAKYGMIGGSVSLSAISALFVHYLGISPALIPAIAIIIVTEIWTGIRASAKQGKAFESFKFSRCVIKIAIWFALFHCAQSFRNEFESPSTFVEQLGFLFFDVLKLLFMILFVIENTTSIMENEAVLDGKDKSAYIEYVKELFKTFFGAVKGIFGRKKRNNDDESDI